MAKPTPKAINNLVSGRSFGFTGTREHLSSSQSYRLAEVLKAFLASGYIEIHHGDCVGADETAHRIATGLGFQCVIHPPTIDKYRAYCGSPKTVILCPKSYLIRNKDIVNDTSYLVACPRGPETLRSGTWSTVRYARKQGKNIVLIDSNGKVDWFYN